MAKQSKTRFLKKQKHGRSYLYWVVAGVALVALAVFLLSMLGNDSLGGGTPKLVVEPAQINLGDVKLGTPMTFVIKVTNAGSGVLRFKKSPYIEVVEGC